MTGDWPAGRAVVERAIREGARRADHAVRQRPQSSPGRRAAWRRVALLACGGMWRLGVVAVIVIVGGRRLVRRDSGCRRDTAAPARRPSRRVAACRIGLVILMIRGGVVAAFVWCGGADRRSAARTAVVVIVRRCGARRETIPALRAYRAPGNVSRKLSSGLRSCRLAWVNGSLWPSDGRARQADRLARCAAGVGVVRISDDCVCFRHTHTGHRSLKRAIEPARIRPHAILKVGAKSASASFDLAKPCRIVRVLVGEPPANPMAGLQAPSEITASPQAPNSECASPEYRTVATPGTKQVRAVVLDHFGNEP